jgi:hypothetical protein
MKRWGCNSIEGRAYRVYAENQLKAHELMRRVAPCLLSDLVEVGFPDEEATRPIGRDGV